MGTSLLSTETMSQGSRNAGTPKFLQRIQKRTGKTPPKPVKEARGASMSQSQSPGGIGFLSAHYSALKTQSKSQDVPRGVGPGKSGGDAPAQFEQDAAPPPPRTRPPKHNPPPQTMSQMPSPPSSATPETLSAFLKRAREVLIVRRHEGCDENWCDETSILLREMQKLIAVLRESETDKAWLESRCESLESQVNKLSPGKDQGDTGLRAAQNKVQLLEVELRGVKLHLEDEQKRVIRLREERDEARKKELEASGNKMVKEECLRLAKKVAELESDNAVLVAEKNQWLAQLENENGQLKKLFEDAKNAKSTMVKELNAIDEERQDIEDLKASLQRQILDAQNKAGASQVRSENRGPRQISTTEYRKIADASQKFMKLQQRLSRRQTKMRAAFSAGSSVIGKHSRNGDVRAMDALYEFLIEASLNGADDLIAQGDSSIEVPISEQSRIERLRMIFESRLKTQTHTLEQGVSQMEQLFVQAFNAALERTSDDDKTQMREYMSGINSIYKDLLEKAVLAGGSAPGSASDMDNMGELVKRAIRGEVQQGGRQRQSKEVDELKKQLKESQEKCSRIEHAHRILTMNVKNTRQALKRYKDIADRYQEQPRS